MCTHLILGVKRTLLHLHTDKCGIMYVHLYKFSQMFVGLFHANEHHKLVPADHIASVCRDYEGIAACHEGHVTV